MLRLTLRSRDDGRFLARVIERDGFAFVLDYGDPGTVADASERVARGFAVMHEGSIRNVAPASNDLLQRLAEYYEHEGMLVKLEEQHLGSFAPQPAPMAPAPLHDALPNRPVTINEEFDDETELVPIDVAIGDQITVIRKKVDLDEETVKISIPVQQRKMWEPGDPRSEDPDDFSLGGLLDNAAPETWAGGDDEETELVPLEMRRRVIAGDDHTEVHSSTGSLKATLSEE